MSNETTNKNRLPHPTRAVEKNGDQQEERLGPEEHRGHMQLKREPVIMLATCFDKVFVWLNLRNIDNNSKETKLVSGRPDHQRRAPRQTNDRQEERLGGISMTFTSTTSTVRRGPWTAGLHAADGIRSKFRRSLWFFVRCLCCKFSFLRHSRSHTTDPPYSCIDLPRL